MAIVHLALTCKLLDDRVVDGSEMEWLRLLHLLELDCYWFA